MKINQVNNALHHKIVGGSEYQWQSWDNARYLDYESDFAYASVVFNFKTQEVYSAEINIKPHSWGDKDVRPYRWLNPDYSDAYRAEATRRGVDADVAWDDVTWSDLEIAEDWLEKAGAIFSGQDFDDRISIPIDFTDAELLKYMKLAHEQDVTFNEFIEQVLREFIEKEKHDSNR